MRGSLELRELSAGKLLSRLSGSFLIYFEIFESKTAVRMGISLTASKRTDTVKIFIDRMRRKRDAPMPRARDSTELQHHFCQFVFFIYIYSVEIIQKHSRRMGRNDIYTLYIGNNVTKFDHLSLNIRQNNRYYRFGSYILNITSKFFEFLRTNTFV